MRGQAAGSRRGPGSGPARLPKLACVASLVSLAALGCRDEPPVERGPEPMREPPQRTAAAPTGDADRSSGASGPAEAPAPASEPSGRAAADPDIERALSLIAASELRFLDQTREPEQAPTPYTAEQFASMLRTKWDWLGYDLTELEPWLDAIATRSFKTNLPYQVVLESGETRELRAWLDAELAASAPER